MTNLLSPRRGIAAFACAIVLSCLPAGAHTRQLDVLYRFHNSDGKFPGPGPLAIDRDGNLYGTTNEGGAYHCGIAFKLAPDGTETVLHTFTRQDCEPIGAILGPDGNYYGSDRFSQRLFKLTPDGTYSIIYEFSGGEYEGLPRIFDKKGNMYGTSRGADEGGDYGTVFKLTPSGQFSHVFVFNSIKLGSRVTALIGDAPGNIYGTTSNTLAHEERYGGIVFKLTPHGALTVLHTFRNPENEQNPMGLTIDSAGNLYGTTIDGGHGCERSFPPGCGTVFRLTADGTFTVLHKFGDARGLGEPLGNPVLDENHNLYGVTSFNYGIYRISADGKMSVLYRLRTNLFIDCLSPGLLWNKGALYGAAHIGRDEIFKLRP